MAPSEMNLSQWRERETDNQIVIKKNSSASGLVGINVKFDQNVQYQQWGIGFQGFVYLTLTEKENRVVKNDE